MVKADAAVIANYFIYNPIKLIDIDIFYLFYSYKKPNKKGRT
jgi:hypothetical protein